MAEKRPHGIKEQVTGPLIVAAVLALVAFFITFITATGGTNNRPNGLLALTIAGAVFVVTLVVCATLILVEKPNNPELGQGTGINRSSAKLYAEARAKREAQARQNKAENGVNTTASKAGSTKTGSAKPASTSPQGSATKSGSTANEKKN
ncbi:MAG: hypothetical protein Q3974_00190 [Rothia sp. (in: high G+C Gram-positive bacteria)]|nr:hypothetical protein [Rothia sp. (in: high G+C Gram-positive bacteria)]